MTENKPQHHAPMPLHVHHIRHNLYVVTGGLGANSGFMIGEKGVLVVDAKMTEESARDMLAEIQKLTPNPIETVVLTHGDVDHVAGLSAFPENITIISHENAKQDMEHLLESLPGSELANHLPNRTITASNELPFDGKIIQIHHFGPSHTGGDLVVVFPEEKTAFIGDMVFINRDPLIHQAKGGSASGLINNLKNIMELDVDIILGGHTGSLTKQDIQTQINTLEQRIELVKSLINTGFPLEEIKIKLKEPELPVHPDHPIFPGLTEVIFNEMKS